MPRLFLDLLDPTLPGEVAIANLDVEVLGHLLAIENRTDRHADLGSALAARVLAADLLLHPGKLAFGGGQQLLALARPFDRQIPIAAHDQPLAREHVGGADLGQVPLVE
jgi:hypothetical protein